MKMKIVLFAGVAGLCLLAADKFQPINAKLGLWEVTSTQMMTGAPPIPAEALAKMPPEQRERMEAMFKQRLGQPVVRTNQTCMTQDKLAKAPFAEEKEACQRTIVSSTSKSFEMHQDCTEKNGYQTSADAKYEVVGDNAMKGSIKVKATHDGHTTNMNIDLSGKWLSADCGNVKK